MYFRFRSINVFYFHSILHNRVRRSESNLSNITIEIFFERRHDHAEISSSNENKKFNN